VQPQSNWGDLNRFASSVGLDKNYVRSYQFRAARQLTGYPSLPKISTDELKRMEAEMISAFQGRDSSISGMNFGIFLATF
jgi:hypothetical protein